MQIDSVCMEAVLLAARYLSVSNVISAHAPAAGVFPVGGGRQRLTLRYNRARNCAGGGLFCARTSGSTAVCRWGGGYRCLWAGFLWFFLYFYSLLWVLLSVCEYNLLPW